ncbi:MAG: hypothetical protein U1F37_13030 [Alphaproteobacteria bacterium]
MLGEPCARGCGQRLAVGGDAHRGGADEQAEQVERRIGGRDRFRGPVGAERRRRARPRDAQPLGLRRERGIAGAGRRAQREKRAVLAQFPEQRAQPRARVVVGDAVRERGLRAVRLERQEAAGEHRIGRGARELAALRVLHDLDRHERTFARLGAARAGEIEPGLGARDLDHRAVEPRHDLLHARAIDAARAARRGGALRAIVGENAAGQHRAAAFAAVAREQDLDLHAAGGRR